MIEACFYVVLTSSFHLDFFLVALCTTSYLLLYNALSYKFHFPSKTSTSLCLHSLCNFLLKLCHPCEVILNIIFFSSVLILCFSFFRFTCSYTVCLPHAFSYLGRYWSYDVIWSIFVIWSIKSIGRRGLYPNNKWYGKYPMELCFVQYNLFM